MKNNFQSTGKGRSQRVWQLLISMLIILTMGIGQMWAADVTLFSTDFSSSDWSGKTFSQGSSTTPDVHNGITFYSSNSTKQFSIADGELSFPNNNIASSNYFLAIPITGVNGSITVTLTNTVSGSSNWNVKYVVKQETSVSTPGSTGTASSSAKTTTTFTVSSLNKSDYVVYIGRSSSSDQYKKIKTITITTPAPAGPVDPTITFNNSNYTIEGSDLDLSSLFTSNSTGAVTYSIKNANGTGAALRADGKSFYATTAGTATVTASQAAVSGTYNAKSVDATITVAVACTPPDAPTGLKVDSKTYNSANLSWDGSGANANGYQIALTSATGAGTFGWKDEATNAYEATGLTPNTEYTFKVKGYAAGKACSSVEVTETFTTNAAPVPTCKGTLFSWIPKTGLSDVDIAAGTHDLPGSWLTSVSGGTAQMYVPSAGNMRIRGSQLAYNSNNAYIHVVLDCDLADGDIIDINSSGNKNNIWLSLTSTRPSSAANAAAAITQGTSFVLSSTNGASLIGENEFYIWRNSSTTQIGQLTISRPYTVTYAELKEASHTMPTKAVELTLEELTNVSFDHKGWTADKTVKLSGVDKAAGFQFDVDAEVELTDNTTFTAVWEAKVAKHTVTYYNGEAIEANKIGTELVNEGSHPNATEIIVPHKLGYTFAGWSTTYGGAATALSGVTVNADMSLYAVWNAVNCSELNGTIFSLVLDKAPAANCTIKNASGFDKEADLIKYGTISGGIAVAKNSSSSNHIVITTDPKLRLLGSSGKVHIQFDCALKEGDTIRTTIENQNISYTTTDARSTANNFEKGTAKVLTITKGHALENATEIYLWAGSSNDGKLISLEVIRPEEFAVTFNLHDHGTPIAPQSILDGGKVTKPSDPSESGWDFGGWFKEAACTNAWDFANDVVNAVTELHAKWTEHAASADATLSALSVAGCTLNETFAPATTTYTVDIPFYASMPAVGDVTATKNDENAKTPVVSITGNVITIHCEAESGATLDYTITVSTASAPTASSSINIEQAVLDNGKTWGYAAALSAANIAIVDANELDSINESKDYRNEPFLGLKFKKATSQFTIVVPASTELNVKFGSISSAAGLKVSVNGSTPAAPSLAGNVYTLAASAGVKEVVFTLDVADKTVVLKQIMVGEAIKDVTLPWKVSFNVGGHADAVNPMVWTGTALTLPGVTNVEDGYAFENWNDGTTDYTAGADYTPASNITLNAVYSMTVEDRLAELEFNGAAVAGFSPDITIYNMTVPYSVALPQITKAVAIDEAGGATATIQATIWDDVYKYYVAQAYVIPAGGTSVDAKFYQVRFTMDPKLGANIFTAELTSPTAATYSGLYADAENSKIALANDGGKYKFAAASNYITIALKDGAFAEGDLLKMTYSADPNQGKLALYPSLSSIDSIVSDDAPAAFLTLPAGSDAYNVLHIRRTSKNNYNGWVSKVEVLREMDPIITSLKVGDDVATINEGAKTIALELPQSADITAIVPNIVAYANGGATVTPAAAQNFTSGPINYTVTSLYGETTTYAVSITKAAASSDATLSALTVNGQAISLEDGVFDYNFELPYGTTSVPTVVATAHHAGAVATVDPCTLSGATITVVPESGVGDQQVYTLTFTISPWKEIVIWDGSNMTALATSPEAVTGMAWATTDFGSIGSYTTTCGEKSYSKYLPSGGASTGRYMTLTVPAGYVAKFYIVMATHSDTKERGMFIGSNLVKDPDETSVLELSNNDRDVAVAGMSEIVGAGTWYINPNASIDFQEIRAYLRPGYARTVSNNIGTLCVDHNVAAADLFGATFYQIAGTEPQYGKIVFDEVFELKAGEPYIFQSTTGSILMFYGETVAPAPVVVKGMIGSYVSTTLSITEANKADIMYISSNKLWNCEDLVGVGLQVVANRCYIDYSQVPPVSSPNPAPGRRRIGISGAPQVATGNETINAGETPVKVMIDGQMYILRGEKMYDATGRLVK